MRSTILPAACAALLAFGAQAAEPTDPVTLETAAAEYRTVPREYRLDGVVEAVNRSTVSAQTQGQVQEILFDVDDYVEKDTVIARLKDTEHQARVAQAAADLKSASARLQQANEEHARISGLHRNKNASDSAMDQASAELASAEGALEAASARLEQTQEQLEYTQVRAPFSGIVTQRHVEVGEIATPGAPVMSGTSLEQLRVTVDVPQSVIPSVRDGGTARVYASEGQTIETDRITVFPYADLGSNTFKVRVELPEGTDSLFPGMFVKTGFVTGRKDELVVRRQAVVFRSEVTGVYVVAADGSVHFRQIRVGRAVDDAFAVLAGISDGERVALDPIAAGVVLKSQASERQMARAKQGNG